jgi:hypothetical protein
VHGRPGKRGPPPRAVTNKAVTNTNKAVTNTNKAVTNTNKAVTNK